MSWKLRAWEHASIGIDLDIINETHKQIAKYLEEQAGKWDNEWKALQQVLAANPSAWSEEDAEHVEEQEWWTNQMRRRAALQYIVGLYHLVETGIGRLLALRLDGVPKDEAEQARRNLHRWDEAKKVIKKYFGVRRADLAKASDINELRLLCNAIKHAGGRVSDKLADVGKMANGQHWVEGKRIELEQIDLTRMAAAVPLFLHDLIDKATSAT